MALASASDLTFNWVGFISAMVSNLTFGFRAVWSKKCASPRPVPDWHAPGLHVHHPLLVHHSGA